MHIIPKSMVILMLLINGYINIINVNGYINVYN